MKMNHVVKVCVLAFFGASLSNTCFADTGLSSGEIKKVRHLSRALLQSRALEKKSIEVEVAPQRAEIKKMEDSLGDLIASELAALTEVSLTPVNTANTATAVFNPQSSVQGAAAAPVVSSESPSTLGDMQAQKKIERLKKQRMKRLQASQAAIREVRLATEGNLPSRFAFWKKKNTRDLRNENIMSIASDVEQALGKMMKDEKIDFQQLKVLQKKVSLNKLDINVDDIAPTFQTRTRHRAQ